MADDERPTPRIATVSQTVGPFFSIGLGWGFGDRVADESAPGRHIAVRGRVVDGDGLPVPDALLELWQADADGRYRGPEAAPARASATFRGHARVPTSAEGAFRFLTVRPGRVPGPGGALQAPHVLVAVFMRGLLRHLATRMYFADEPSNDDDPALQLVPTARRRTLLATRSPATPDAYEWNIVLQGADETVFFDL